jgi:replication initiation protein RepC
MTTQTYPTLPQGHQRFTVEQLLIELAPVLGLRGGRLHALLYMMKQTAPAAWTDPSREPVFFAPQDQTAEALHKTARALRNDEAALHAAGLIEKRVKGNGSRSPFGGCGIVFSRLIALVPDLMQLKEQLAADRKLRKELRNRRSTFVRYIMQCHRDATPDALSHPRLIELHRVYEAWPTAARLATMPMDDLESHVEDAKTLCENMEIIHKSCRDSSGMAEENFPCFIQENNQDSKSVSCNASADKKSVGKPTHVQEYCSGPIGPENCLEEKKKGGEVPSKAEIARLLNPERLFNLASEDMQDAISTCRGTASRLQDIHMMDAAAMRICPLGINHDAWAKAIEAIGLDGATLCVFLIDANRDHPTSPIRNPGGALRAMTKRFRAGNLNIVGSLLGLARRKNG